jgi:hypothetical protein
VRDHGQHPHGHPDQHQNPENDARHRERTDLPALLMSVPGLPAPLGQLLCQLRFCQVLGQLYFRQLLCRPRPRQLRRYRLSLRLSLGSLRRHSLCLDRHRFDRHRFDRHRFDRHRLDWHRLDWHRLN